MNTFKSIIPILIIFFVMGCKNNSTNPEPEPEPQCNLSVSVSSVEIEMGESETLSASKTDGCVGLITWESDNTDILSLDKSGGKSVEATAESDGETAVTISVEDADGSIKSRVIDATVSYSPIVAYKKTATDGSNENIWTVNENGIERQITHEASNWDMVFPAVQWMNNGEKLAYATHEGSKVYSIDLNGNNKQAITTEDIEAYSFRISNDEEKIAVAGIVDDNYGVYTQNRNNNEITEIETSAFRPDFVSWSPDDQFIAVTGYHQENTEDGKTRTGADIYKMNIDQSGTARLVGDRFTYDTSPVWSPFDNDKILFLSDMNGETATYTMDADGDNIQMVSSEFYCTDWISEDELVCMGQKHGNDYDLYRVKLDGSYELIIDTPEHELSPAWKTQ